MHERGTEEKLGAANRLTLGAKANPGRLLARINHTFLKKLFFTECTEIRTEVTEPNTWSAL